ncbi:MAG: hypothetical protein LUI60_02805 [Clostridia bacterium]|nr:hypothetical protein [Clostridia bacterium]
MLIKQTGSTQDGSNEKIRSGQSYLYKKHGMESEVLEIRLIQNVRGDCLTRALSETIKRYPYLNTKIIEKDGDFYIVQNNVALVARKTDKLIKLGGIECNYHLIDITYYKKSIYISFHHALCDGRGIKPFIETLIWYYCAERYNSRERVDGIRYSDDKLLENETADPFIERYTYDENKEYISLSRDAFCLPEDINAEGDYRFEIALDHDEFMVVCKRNNATPVILLSLLMNSVIGEMYPERDKVINANIATDMRSALGCENTFKNCVKTMILPYDRQFQNKPLIEQATEYRKLLNEQRDPDYCKREACAMLGLFDKLDRLNGYDEKQKIMAFFEGMSLKTYVISYLGQFILGCNQKYIDSIYLYNSGTIGLGINMVSCGNKFNIIIKQSFSNSVYAEAFCKKIKDSGISCNYSGAIRFETPADKIIKHDI